MKTKISKFIKEYEVFIVVVILLLISLSTFIYYFQDLKNLPYADAISRLNIARKIVDNITPGFAQVGNVWLPLPQILMVPFIWNSYLWHSGIAGYLMSGISFILGGLYIYRTAKMISNSIIGSLCALGVYALNINVFYLQTTAMSESIFACSLAATIYYFMSWFKTNKPPQLILAGIWISIMTLIRYEGLALLFASIPMVFIYKYIKTKSIRKTEGTLMLFVTVACLGFGLWTLYLTAIFGDPLFWKNYYATPQATGGAEAIYTQAKPFTAAVWQYFTSVTWMSGVIPMIYAGLGLIILLISSIRNKSLMFMPVLLPSSIFLFMVLTLQRNTPIVQPELNWANITSGATSLQTGFNIRYGLLLIPWIAILSAYVFRFKIGAISLLLFFAMIFQVHTYFYNDYTIIYKIPDRVAAKPYGAFAAWIQQNYDGGKILISAGSLEDQMFQTGFNYSTFIHEGTDKYWKESIDNPSRYAKWVVIDYGHNSDNVARNMNREDILEREYKLVYEEKQLRVFKKITDPYYQI